MKQQFPWSGHRKNTNTYLIDNVYCEEHLQWKPDLFTKSNLSQLFQNYIECSASHKIAHILVDCKKKKSRRKKHQISQFEVFYFFFLQFYYNFFKSLNILPVVLLYHRNTIRKNIIREGFPDMDNFRQFWQQIYSLVFILNVPFISVHMKLHLVTSSLINLYIL